jgi:hypothetical protein
MSGRVRQALTWCLGFVALGGTIALAVAVRVPMGGGSPDASAAPAALLSL